MRNHLAGRPVDELSVVLASRRHVDEDVIRLILVAKRPLERIVVVRRDDHRVPDGASCLPESARETRQEPMQCSRRIIGIEEVVQLLVEEVFSPHHRGILRNANEVPIAFFRVCEVLGKVARQLAAAWQVLALLPGAVRRSAAQVDAGAKQRDDLPVRHQVDDEAAVSIEEVRHVVSSVRSPSHPDRLRSV
jgi:hypothetical protein